MTPLRALIRSFRFAIAGIAYVLRSERNLQIHAVATVAAAATGWWLRISPGEWCAILLAMGLVWAAEILNTALERLGDALTRELNDDVRRAKDAAAGAVLVAAIIAAAVGTVIFLPKLAALALRDS